MAEPHPSALWRLLSTQPDLLGQHASAYGALIEEQVVQKLGHWRRALMRQVALLMALGIAWMSAEVAIMLWATSIAPGSPMALAVLAGCTLLPVAVALYLLTRKELPAAEVPSLSQVLQTQLKADWSLLQEAGP